jgi:squalene-hopene/tetraprenyl-beta-curcumene cyclase
MNTTELVHPRLLGRRALPTSEPRSTPRFCTELAGSVRHAILRSRQFLISQCRPDGTWLGVHSPHASLTSLLVFWLVYTGSEDSELAQQCAATLIDQQLAGGGWSRWCRGRADVNTSVQAYFALKLLGIDPASARMARARKAIRQLGGADASDIQTRHLLALFGQISYDHCPALPLDSAFDDSRSECLTVALATLRSHRPVHETAVPRGVRELFIAHPAEWPTLEAASRSTGFSLSNPVRLLAHRVARPEALRRAWRSWRDPQSRALKSVTVDKLNFNDLIWHSLALRAASADSNDHTLAACDARIREHIHINDDTDSASPQLTLSAEADTAVVVQSLLSSGASKDHWTIAQAIEHLNLPADFANASTFELCNRLMAYKCEIAQSNAAALPPEIEVCDDWDSETFAVYHEPAATDDSVDHPPTAAADWLADAHKQLLTRQNADGSWSENGGFRDSRHTVEPATTGIVLQSLAESAPCAANQRNIDRGVHFLGSSQQADGSWGNTRHASCARSTSQAICGLLSTGISSDDTTVAAGVNWLVVHQDIGGGWRNTISDDHGPEDSTCDIATTAMALAALVASGNANHRAARRAVEFLVNAQDDNGGWSEPNSENDLHTAAWPLIALSRWAVAASSAQSEATGEMSLRLVGASAER